MQPAGFGAEQNAREDLHACARRHRTCNDAQLLRELLALNDNFHPRPNNGVGFNHLKNLVVVIGDVDVVEEALLPPG
jgi:hypothetical protein